VLGAGILGASTALLLARRGISGPPACTSARRSAWRVTGATCRWTRASTRLRHGWPRRSRTGC